MAQEVDKLKRDRRVHVHHLITKLELGGAQQNTLYCVKNHDREKYTVSLGAGPGGELDAEARRTPRTNIQWFPRLRREIRPATDILFAIQFARFLRSQGVDILHTHSSKAGILGRFAARLAGTPIVIHTVHGWGFHDYQSFPVRALYVFLERLAAARTDLLIAVSRENVTRGLQERIGRPAQYRVIRSGIDISRFRAPPASRLGLRRRLGIPAAAPVVGTVGNFKPQKAPLDFIKAAAIVAGKVRESRFVMVGDGAGRKEAEDLAIRLGIRRRVVFTGWRRDIPELLSTFDVFALSSLFEGLPRSVLQAMAAGRPVVATRAGGTPEAVRDGVTGYVVPRGDPRALAARIARLLRSPVKARGMGRRGRRLLGREFEIRGMLDSIEEAYEELADRKGLGAARP